MRRDRELDRELDSELAVVAHGLLNPITVVVGVLETLRQLLGPDFEHDDLLVAAKRQALFVAGSLRDFVHGLPPDLIDTLRRLEEFEHLEAVPGPVG